VNIEKHLKSEAKSLVRDRIEGQRLRFRRKLKRHSWKLFSGALREISHEISWSKNVSLSKEQKQTVAFLDQLVEHAAQKGIKDIRWVCPIADD